MNSKHNSTLLFTCTQAGTYIQYIPDARLIPIELCSTAKCRMMCRYIYMYTYIHSVGPPALEWTKTTRIYVIINGPWPWVNTFVLAAFPAVSHESLCFNSFMCAFFFLSYWPSCTHVVSFPFHAQTPWMLSWSGRCLPLLEFEKTRRRGVVTFSGLFSACFTALGEWGKACISTYLYILCTYTYIYLYA